MNHSGGILDFINSPWTSTTFSQLALYVPTSTLRIERKCIIQRSMYLHLPFKPGESVIFNAQCLYIYPSNRAKVQFSEALCTYIYPYGRVRVQIPTLYVPTSTLQTEYECKSQRPMYLHLPFVSSESVFSNAHSPPLYPLT